jgi:hypothetical protein
MSGFSGHVASSTLRHGRRVAQRQDLIGTRIVRGYMGEMAGITGVDHELNSALPIPPWTLAIPATFAKSLGVCVLRVNG